MKMTRNLHYSDLMMIGELWYDRTPCAACDSPSDKRKHGRNGEKQRDKQGLGDRTKQEGSNGRKGEKKWRDQVGERQERDTIKCKINLEEEMFLWL